jgi:hypothetical protein
MRCWITILGGVLIMKGQHSGSEALFYCFRLEALHARFVELSIDKRQQPIQRTMYGVFW